MDSQEYGLKTERCLKNIEKDTELNEENKRLIFEFYRELEDRRLSVGRVSKYVWTLKSLLKLTDRSVLEMDSEGIRSMVRKIVGNPKWKDWTKHDFEVILRKFIRWVNEKYSKSLDTSCIRPKIDKKSHKMPEELLTEEEVEQLVNACDNQRDRALISVLYESGCRIGEILGLQLKHIQFDQHGAVLMVCGKTGQRRVRIVSSAPILSSFMESHPFKGVPESYLWLTKFNRKGAEKKGWNPLMYRGISSVLKKSTKKAGIKKRVYPHIFRHSRATHLSKILTEAQMKEYFGWVQASEMASVYVHLSGRDVDSALLKAYGLQENDEKEEQKIKPVRCFKCKEQNSSLDKRCKRCGYPLDEKEIMRIEQKKTMTEDLLIEFLKTVADEFPQVKQKFREITEQRNAGSIFE